MNDAKVIHIFLINAIWKKKDTGINPWTIHPKIQKVNDSFQNPN